MKEKNSGFSNYSLYLKYLLIINTFKRENIYILESIHSAIPINTKELREIYDLVYKSQYKSAILDCLHRDIGYVQFQSLYISYIFIKYKRKVKKISYNYIEIKMQFKL